MQQGQAGPLSPLDLVVGLITLSQAHCVNQSESVGSLHGRASDYGNKMAQTEEHRELIKLLPPSTLWYPALICGGSK